MAVVDFQQTQKPFCTNLAVARNENNSSAFVAGCDNFRIFSLKKTAIFFR
jgi:hypothetical protein